jgi:c-di-GMP-binding flagellar brake protein YcgR
VADKKEKRTAPRWDCRVPIMCRRGSDFDSAQTLDISRGGVGLLTRKFIPVNTNMIMEIALSPHAAPVMVLGRVCWVQKSASAESYRLGMNFTEIASDSRNRLAGYLDDII